MPGAGAVMALAEARLVLRFAGGVETKTDHKAVLPTKLLALENAVFTKAISLVKRFGYEDLGAEVIGSDSALPTSVALGRRQFELLAFSGRESHSYVDELGAWAPAGAVQSVICDHEPMAKTGSDQTLADMAVLSGIAVYAWEDSRGGVWYAVLDDYTGRSIVPPTQVDAGGQRPRAHAVGPFVHVYWVRAAAQEIRLWRIDPTEPTRHEEGILITNVLGSAPHYDIDTDSTKAVIGWHDTDGQIGVGYVHSSGVLGGLGLGLPVPATVAAVPTNCLAVALDKSAVDPSVALAWSDGTGTRYTVLAETLGAEFAAREVAAVQSARVTCVFVPGTGGAINDLWISSEDLGASHRVRHVLAEGNVDDFNVLAQRDQRGLVLGGKAFIDDGDAYVITMRDSTLFRTYFVQPLERELAVARFLPGVAGGRLTRAHLPSVTEEAARAVRFSAIYVTDVESRDSNVFAEKGIRRVSLDFASDEAFRSVQLGRTLYLTGGLVQAYDGERWQEAGFHYGPDDLATPTLDAPTTGPGLADGTYGYVAVFENILANGEVERGPRSAAVLVTVTGGPRRVTVTLPTYGWATKPGARIGVYRSTNGDAAVLNRVSSLNPSTAGQVNGYVANDPTVDSVTFIDEMSDDTLAAQEPLYTNGGVVPNKPLGAARLLWGGKGRLFAVDPSQPNRVYHTQEIEEGFAAEFSPFLFVDVDPFGGDVNGGIVMDDANVVFKETAVHLFGGPGPAPNPAQGGGWTRPELVTSDVGCSSPDSPVYTPIGVAFQSLKGIYLLGRDRAVRYIGAPVEAFNSQRIVAATLIEDRTQIRFLTDSGTTLLYDYLFDQWSTFTNHEGQDALVVDGQYTYLRNDGQVWTETPDAYVDNNSQILMSLGSAWLRFAEHIQGWQRLWYAMFIGEYRSPHTVRVRAFYDYEAGHEDEWVFDPADFINLPGYGEGLYGQGAYGQGDGGVPSQRYEFEVAVHRQCSAVRFTIDFLESVGDAGAAGEITELVLTGGALRSRAVLEDARRL